MTAMSISCSLPKCSCRAPHPERANTLDEIETEMTSLYQVLGGTGSKEANISRQKKNISELVSIIRKHPERFMGFGSVR